jgi:hypothetical protein
MTNQLQRLLEELDYRPSGTEITMEYVDIMFADMEAQLLESDNAWAEKRLEESIPTSGAAASALGIQLQR